MSDNYRILAKMSLTLHAGHGGDPDERKRAIGLITDGFHQCKAIHSGLVSENAQHLKVSQMTKDHYLSRKKGAIKIFEMIDAGATIDELTAFVIEVCNVHYVTKRENLDLIPYQKNTALYPTWQEQYAAAGIKLVPYIKKSNKKYVYIINEIEYNSPNDAAIANDCKISDVYYRCIKSNSEYFSAWTIKQIKE